MKIEHKGASGVVDISKVEAGTPFHYEGELFLRVSLDGGEEVPTVFGGWSAASIETGRIRSFAPDCLVTLSTAYVLCQ